MGVADFIRRWFLHAPSYAGFLKLGYKARTYNGDFIFSFRYSQCSVNVHQGIEPHNKKLSEWIDFEIDDACVVITAHEGMSLSRSQIDTIREYFDFVYERGPHLFCMDRHMDFNDPKLEQTIIKLHNFLS